MKIKFAAFFILIVVIIRIIISRVKIIDGRPVSDGDINSMRSAIQQYESIFSMLPLSTTNQVEQDNEKVMLSLGAFVEQQAHSTNSPRKIRLLNLPPASMSSRCYLDPWGHPYHIALTVNKTESIKVGKHTISDEIAIWSNGPNGSNEFGDGDDIVSWKK